MRFPWRCVLVVAALMVVCLLVVGCGGEEEEPATPTPSPIPSPTATRTAGPGVAVPTREGPVPGLPPDAVLRAGDGRQTGALGTFCWTRGCSDPFAVVVPTEPLTVPTREPLVFELGFDPTELHIAAWRADQGEIVWGPSDIAFSWRPARFEDSALEQTPPPGRTIELRPDLPPGTYVVDVLARAAGGSASYGFHLEIVP